MAGRYMDVRSLTVSSGAEGIGVGVREGRGGKSM